VYWASEAVVEAFSKGVLLGSFADIKRGMTTSENARFPRLWSEVSDQRSCKKVGDQASASASGAKWFPYSKGGGYRKWFRYSEYYKKRAIYWLVTSPNGSFQALLYLHRYTRDTVNTVLNKYLREFIHKLDARLHHLANVEATTTSAREKTAARKEADKLRKSLKECQDWERDVVLTLAQQHIELDLDDGVKVNYLKPPSMLSKIPGFDKKEEDWLLARGSFHGAINDDLLDEFGIGRRVLVCQIDGFLERRVCCGSVCNPFFTGEEESRDSLHAVKSAVFGQLYRLSILRTAADFISRPKSNQSRGGHGRNL